MLCLARTCSMGKKIPVKGRSLYSSKSAIEIFSGNFSQSIYCHFWFSWYVTSCHIFNFRVILGSTFWFDDLVNNIETHHLDLFDNIDWTFELYTFHWNLRCQYFWKCDCPAWCYLRIWKRRVPQQLWGGVGIWVSSAQRERERECVWHASYVFECTVYRSGQELGVSSVQGAPAPVQHSIRHRQTCLDQSYFSPASSFNSVPWETLCHFVCILNWNQSRHDNINSILSCSRRH